MATHKSAEKRNRQNIKRNERNRAARATFRTEIKKAVELTTEKKFAEAEKSAKLAMKLLDKAANKSLVHKKNASRRISRLFARIHAAKSAKA